MSLKRRKLAFLSIVNNVKGFVRKVVGQPPLTLANCVDDKSLIDYKIYGDSVQDKKNLLLYDIKTTTSNGVTWTVNEDRSITVSGTPSAYSGFGIFSNTLIDSSWVGKTFTIYGYGISADGASISREEANCQMVINFYDSEGTALHYGDILGYGLSWNTVYNFIVPENAIKVSMNIQRRSNNVECTGTFYPMLLMGEYTADNIPAFEDTFPYIDNPIEIQSVGEKTSNILDVENAPFVHNARTAQTISALFERTSTGFKGSFYRDLTGTSMRIGYTLGRTEDFKGKTITVSYDEAILNPGAKPIIAIYTVNKPGVNIDYMDENTTFNEVIDGYVGSSSSIGISAHNADSQHSEFFSYTIPEDADSESFPYVCALFYIGYNAESNPADSTFEYKGIKVEVASNENVFDNSKATILKRLSDSTAEFDGNELVITKTRDTAQERTVVTIPTPKKNTYMNVVVNGGDGTSQYGIYMTNEIPTSPTVITTHGVNTEDYAYVNIVIIIDTAYTGTLRYNITLNECGTAEYEPFGYKIPVVARGKNLCPNDWETGFINTSTGVNQSNGDYVRTKDYFILNVDKIYYISSDDIEDSTTISWYFYDENKSFIERQVSYRNRTIATNGNVKIPENAVFYRLSIKTNNTDIKMQIDEGSEATPYEPYVKPITTNIYIGEPIRRIFNGVNEYADSIDFANKKVIRNIASVIPESSKWSSYSDGSGGIFAGKRCGIVPNAISGAGQYFNCMCDKFPSARRNDMYNIGQQGISASETVLRLLYPGLTDLSDADFRACVDENPIQVDYILAEPIEEIIDTSTLPTFKGTTIYEIDTTTQPSKMEVEYYSTSKE